MSKSEAELVGAEDPSNTRVSITLPSDCYDELKQISSEKRVSVAWVVRDAVHEYLKQRTPLLR